MCRVVFARASREGLGILSRLVDAHLEASKDDPLLAAITGGDGRHCHGYGYVLLAKRGGGWTYYYHRFDAADYLGPGEEACKANLEHAEVEAERLKNLLRGAEEALLLLHSRRASRRSPRGTLEAHPYQAKILGSDGVAELYLAHNGGVHHEDMAKSLGLYHTVYTDSHVLALWIAERIREGLDPIEALAEGARYTKSAYIVGVIYWPRTAAPTLLVSAIVPKEADEKRKAYYQPYQLRAPGIKALISPTVKDKLGETIGRVEKTTITAAPL